MEELDKDLLEFQKIAQKSILKKSKYKLFFTQSEFEEYYGEITFINYIHDKIQKKYSDEIYLENRKIKLQEMRKNKKK